MKLKFVKEEAVTFNKAGVKMWKYVGKGDCPQASVLYQEVSGGHYTEFLNHKSAFIYYILEGKGSFIIEDKEYKVKATDVIIVPPNKRFYYLGNMKQILINSPAWEEETDELLRKIPH